jgi:hypothetical protein
LDSAVICFLSLRSQGAAPSADSLIVSMLIVSCAYIMCMPIFLADHPIRVIGRQTKQCVI